MLVSECVCVCVCVSVCECVCVCTILTSQMILAIMNTPNRYPSISTIYSSVLIGSLR